MKRMLTVIDLLAVLLIGDGCAASEEYRHIQTICSSLSQPEHFVEVTANSYHITTGKIRLPNGRLDPLRNALAALQEARKPLEKTKRVADYKFTLHAPGVVLEGWVPVDSHWFYLTLNRGTEKEARAIVRQRDKELHTVLKAIFEDYVTKPVFTVDGQDVPLSSDQIIEKNVGEDPLQDEAGNLLEVTSVRRDGEKCKYLFYPSGRLRAVKRYREGMLHGIRLKFFENGCLEAVMPYERGQLNGMRVFLDEDGNVISSLKFRNGKQVEEEPPSTSSVNQR